jgi:hypothetical protein
MTDQPATIIVTSDRFGMTTQRAHRNLMQAIEILSANVQATNAQAATASQRRGVREWNGPITTVVIGSAHEVLDDSTSLGLVERLARQARKGGIRLELLEEDGHPLAGLLHSFGGSSILRNMVTPDGHVQFRLVTWAQIQERVAAG